MAGSRFNSDAESRYAPIEGEALAVVWALEQSKFFTQGCDKLIVATDHKPLVGLLMDRTMDQVSNARLLRIKQKILLWKFTVIHVPGKTNYFTDATSRRPSGQHDVDGAEAEIAAFNHASIAVTTEEAAARAATEREYVSVVRALEDDERPLEACGEYQKLAEKMYARAGLLYYKDRLVVPKALREKVLDILHAAHQGMGSMQH